MNTLKRKILSIILVIAIVLSLVTSLVYADPENVAQNTSTSTNYTDLHVALTACKSGETVELLKNVDLNDVSWTPVAFQGTFDGKDHTISNLKVNVTEGSAGLFASVSGIVKNLVIEKAEVKSTADSAAVLAGTAYGSINNVTVKDSTVTTSGEYAGAIVAHCSSSIIDCTVTDCEIKAKEQVGGIVGYHWCGNITDCEVTKTTVTATADRAGGLIGKLQFARSNNGANLPTYKAGTMSVKDNSFSGTVNGIVNAGGIVGQLMGDYNSEYGDIYEVKNNAISGTLNGTCTNAIANLRSEQPECFRNSLPTSVTGNTWNDVPQKYSTTGVSSDLVYVAKIGAESYETLADALKAAKTGDTIEILVGTWGAEAIGSLTTAEAGTVRYKSLTIQPANGATVKFTSNVGIGYDDSSTANASITVKDFSFEEASLSISNYVNVTIENCEFTGSGSKVAGALVVQDACCTNHKTQDSYPASLVTITNCKINGTNENTPGIRLRNTGNVTLTDNEIKNSKHNGILFESNASIDATPVKVISVTGNTVTEWNANDIDGGGRAIRFAAGNLATNSTVTITGNYFTKSTLGKDEPDFIKITEATNATINLDGNCWNNKLLTSVSGEEAYYTVNGSTPEINSVISDMSPVAKIGDVGYESLANAVAAVKSHEIITMVKGDVLTKELSISADKNFTLDLNGKTIEIASTGFDFTTTKSYNGSIPARFMIVVDGTMTITDSSSAKRGKISAKNYSYGTTKAILVKDHGNVVVNSGEIYGQYAAFYVVGYTGTTPLDTDIIPTLTVNGGKIIGDTVAIGTKGKTATLTVNDNAYIYGKNSYAISTNGTTDWYDGGNNVININGGKIESENGFAMYLPAEAVVTIKGGTLTGSSGVVVKGGSVTISDNAVINAIGAKGVAGATESGARDTGDALYIEDTYDNHKPIVPVTGGKLKSANGFTVQYYTNKESADMGSVTISGGLYSTRPEATYLGNGKVTKLNDDSKTKTDYPFAVGTPDNSNHAEVNDAPNHINATTVSTDKGATTEEVSAATVANSAISDDLNVSGIGIDVASTKVAEDNDVTGDATYTTGDGTQSTDTLVNAVNDTEATASTAADVAIVVQSYSEITVTDVKLVGNDASKISTITYEITPMVQKVATSNEIANEAREDSSVIITVGEGRNAVKVGLPEVLKVTRNTTVTIPLPNTFVKDNSQKYDDGESVDVKHIKSSGEEYYYKGTIINTNTLYAVIFENPNGFSSFTVMADAGTVASVTQSGTTVYFTTLQGAVDYVVSGGKITLHKNNAGTAVVEDEISFTFDKNGKTDGEINAGTTYKKTVSGTTYIFTYITPEEPSYDPSELIESDSEKIIEDNLGFVDVNTSDYFYTSVAWAKKNNITSGLDITHFAPYGITTRAQMVTFLWRAAGKPEPTSTACAFTDINSNEYYVKAILWAVENGITKGITETTFVPDGNVTRAQAVTFIARLNGIKDDISGYTHNFSDVISNDYFNNAVAWAATNGITSGVTDTSFVPYDSCLRCQIVTFLYRNFVK